MGISTIVRLNNKLYDAKVFSDNGFNHVELYFPDGHNPTDQILNSFLELSRRAPGGVAVHCKAGLGRTGTLICAYMMRYHNFTAAEAIGFRYSIFLSFLKALLKIYVYFKPSMSSWNGGGPSAAVPSRARGQVQGPAREPAA